MSKKNILFAVSCILYIWTFGNKINAQIKEGHFQYVIMTTPVDTSLETRQKIGLLQDSKMDLFFMENKSRLDFNMGTAFYTCIVVDNTLPRALSLNKGPQGAYAAYLGKNDLEKNKTKDSTARIELIDETRVIHGFKCKKAILYQNNEVTIYWYTNEISIDMKGNPLLNELIPGFPLSFITVKEGMKVEYIVSNYLTEIKNKDIIFSLMVPEGYKLISNGY